MSSWKLRALRAGDRLYRRHPGLYRPLFHAYKRVSDRLEIAATRALVKPGTSCADVGANIGFYSRLLSGLVGPGGTVRAYEPAPENFAHLARWSPPNVVPVQAAVGESPGVLALYESADLNVDHRTYPVEGRTRTTDVRVVRLDDEFPDGRLDFVKMDIQGSELRALRGMGGILRSRRPLALVLEFWPWGLRQAGDSAEELLECLASAGCTVRRPDGAPVGAWTVAEDWHCNLVAVRT